MDGTSVLKEGGRIQFVEAMKERIHTQVMGMHLMGMPLIGVTLVGSWACLS
jgi:hypothetical protein